MEELTCLLVIRNIKKETEAVHFQLDINYCSVVKHTIVLLFFLIVASLLLKIITESSWCGHGLRQWAWNQVELGSNPSTATQICSQVQITFPFCASVSSAVK